MGEARLRTHVEPHQRGSDGDQHDGGNKNGRHLIRQAANGGLAALGFFDQCNNPGQRSVLTDGRGRVEQGATFVEGAGADRVSRCLVYRHGLAGEHGFIDAAFAFLDGTVHGNFFTGANAQGVAVLHLLHRDVLFHFFLIRAIADHAGGFGAQVQQPFYCGAGLAASANLQCLAEIDQADDHGAGFEIHMPGGFWQGTRQQDHHHGVQPGGTSAQCNQGVHVGVMITEGFPGADKKMPAGGSEYGEGGNADAQPYPLADFPGANHHVATEQAPGHQRHAQAEPQPHVPQQLAVVCPLFGFLLIVVIVTGFTGAISSVFHRLNQGVGAGGAGDLSGAVGKVHVRAVDAGCATQRAFNGAHAGRAGGAADVQLY